MSYYQPSVSLHQQDGGMTVQAFAAQHGMTAKAMRHYIKTGRVVGARQDARSKKWTIYPPAKLVDKSGDCMKRREPSACQTVEKLPAVAQATPDGGENFTRAALGSVEVVDVGTSPHGLSAGLSLPHQKTPEALSLAPPASQQAERAERQAMLAGGFGYFSEWPRQQPEGEAQAGRPDVYTSAEAKSIRRTLLEAAARMHREGIHYLHLDSREFSQLYAALDHERSRIRKLVGKGLVDVGNLRASDSVWQKMQAMCHEGRLL